MTTLIARDPWRPIQTAPKDGTPVLLYSPDAKDPKIFVGMFVKFDEEDKGEWFDYWRDDGCWCIDAESTHWMPLPAPPIRRKLATVETNAKGTGESS